eukprot:490464-Prorocentrum_minimum.AAC.1
MHVTAFTITSGPCQTSSGGYCLESPNYPLNYGHDQRCTIAVSMSGTLDVVFFNTESPYDAITVNGLSYAGDGRRRGPHGIKVEAPTTFRWETDFSTDGRGFQICLISGYPILPCRSPSSVFTLGVLHGRAHLDPLKYAPDQHRCVCVCVCCATDAPPPRRGLSALQPAISVRVLPTFCSQGSSAVTTSP